MMSVCVSVCLCVCLSVSPIIALFVAPIIALTIIIGLENIRSSRTTGS